MGREYNFNLDPDKFKKFLEKLRKNMDPNAEPTLRTCVKCQKEFLHNRDTVCWDCVLKKYK